MGYDAESAARADATVVAAVEAGGSAPGEERLNITSRLVQDQSRLKPY